MNPRQLTKQKQSLVNIEAFEQDSLVKEHGISVKGARGIGGAALGVARIIPTDRNARTQQEEHAR